jgi:outer membrane protein OmpA-like peptidoglycan-associated protein
MELPAEQFEAQSILADISMKIAQGRAELAKQQAAKEDFLLQREQEAIVRVELVLKAARTSLEEAEKYNDQLKSYDQELTSWAKELMDFGMKIAENKANFDAKNDQLNAETDQKLAEIAKLQEEIKIASSIIESDKKQLKVKALGLMEQERAIKDRYETLLRTENHVR